MSKTEIQVIGLCRFSMLSTGAFQSAPDELHNRLGFLFESGRLKRRLSWFRYVAAPSIRAQTDKNFVLLLLTSDLLPQWALSELQRIISDMPQVKLVQLSPGDHRTLCKEAIHAHIDPLARRVVQFRLDDDDAIGRDYVQSIRGMAMRTSGPLGGKQPFSIDFTNGILLRYDSDQGLDADHVQARLWTPALAIVFPHGAKFSLMDFPHHVLWRRMLNISVPHRCMFVRGAHGENDGGEIIQFIALKHIKAKAITALKERFDIDFEAFRSHLDGL